MGTVESGRTVTVSNRRRLLAIYLSADSFRQQHYLDDLHRNAEPFTDCVPAPPLILTAKRAVSWPLHLRKREGTVGTQNQKVRGSCTLNSEPISYRVCLTSFGTTVSYCAKSCG